MALGDVGLWLPAESQYAKPGSYEDALRAEAVKTASYLASMDQFYANLEEAKSEFGQTLAFKEKELAQSKELTLGEQAIMREQLAQQKTLYEENLAQNEKLTLGAQDIERTSVENQYELGTKGLSLKEKELAQNKRLSEEQMGIEWAKVGLEAQSIASDNAYKSAALGMQSQELNLASQKLEAGENIANRNLDYLMAQSGVSNPRGPSWERPVELGSFSGPSAPATTPTAPKTTPIDFSLDYLGTGDYSSDFYAGIPDLNWATEDSANAPSFGNVD